VPVTADLYWPKAARERLPEKEMTAERKRDKIDIALDHPRWVARQENIPGRKPAGVVADVWYGSSPRYVRAINDELNWRYVVGIRPNRTIFIQLPGERGQPEHRAEDALPYLKADDFDDASVRRSDGRDESVWVAKINGRARRVKVKGATRSRAALSPRGRARLGEIPRRRGFRSPTMSG
jgi:hypothetical protein